MDLSHNHSPSSAPTPGQKDIPPHASQRSLASLLNEVGLVAAGHGKGKKAEHIFDALAVLKPASEVPYIGHAIAAMNAGKWEDAARLLEDKALKKAPDSESAQCFLGLALKQKGDAARSQEVLESIADNGRDPSAIAMAKALLGRDVGNG